MESADIFANTISTTTAIEQFKISRSYVTQLARTGSIKAQKFGRDWVIDPVSLRDFLAEHKRRGPQVGAKYRPRRNVNTPNIDKCT